MRRLARAIMIVAAIIAWLTVVAWFGGGCSAYGQDREHYVVMFTSKSCSPCRVFAQGGRLGELRSRYPVTVVSIDDQPQWLLAHGDLPAVDRLPTFWVLRRSDRRRIVHQWRGAVSPDMIADALRMP